MDHARLLTALRRDTDAEVLHDAASLAAYARDASNYPVGPAAVVRPRSAAGLDAALRDFTDRRLALLRTDLTPWPRRVSGYGLEPLLPEHGFQVARSLVGTEGGCAPVTGATLKLVRMPAELGLLVLGFPDDIAAADAVPALLPHRPYTVEGFAVDLLGDVPPQGLLPAGQAWLFVQVGGGSPAAVADHADRLIKAAGRSRGDQSVAVILDPATRARIWALRADGAGRATRAPSGAAA